MDAYDISQYKGRYSKLLGEFNPNSVNYNPDLLRRLKGEKEETFLTWDTFSKYFGVFFGGVVVGIVATVLIMCWWDCCCMRCLRSCTSCDRCKNYNEIEDGTEGAE
uniref:Cysteine string protein n=1 Tax=Strongyloides stercoralis TaxID=6248 RepID=A0A0K0E5G5_STRER